MTIEQIGLLCSFGVNFLALYGAFRRTKTAANVADVQLEAEAAKVDDTIAAGIIAKWRDYAAKMEQDRERDAAKTAGIIEQMRHELETSRREGGECRERAARQEVTIDNLKDDLKELRGMLKRAGVKPGTADHDPLPT